MILYSKKTNENNILGYEYIYEDKNNYVFLVYPHTNIKSIDVQEKSLLGDIDNNDFIYTLDNCYEIVNYGKLEFRIGQTTIY